MDELPAEARAFLEAQRDAHDPPAGMSERVWRAAGLGEAAALTGLAPRLRLEPTWWKGGSASLAAKAAGGALIVASLALGGWLWSRGEAPRALPAASTLDAPAPSTGEAAPKPAQPAVLEPTPGLGPPTSLAAPQRVQSARRPRLRGTADDLLDEITALREASAALDSGQPARALVLLKEYRTRFASAKLKQERDALTALAQCALGDRAAARGYLRDHPQGVLNDRVERACKLQREAP